MTEINCSTSGSVMLMGEHSVLQGHPAVVAAVQQRINLTLSRRSDLFLVVKSDIENCKVLLNEMPLHGKLNFVFACINYCKKKYSLSQGFNLTYQSDIDNTLGLGSSAAVVVITMASLLSSLKISYSNKMLWIICHEVTLGVQGRGSGADICASIYGGVNHFNIDEGFCGFLNIEDQKIDWCMYYCGYKTTTTEVLRQVQQTETLEPEKIKRIYSKMGLISHDFIRYFKNKKWTNVGILMDNYHQQMIELGVSDQTLENMIAGLKKKNIFLGVKISGSGLGDCLLTLKNRDGIRAPSLEKYLSFPMSIDYKGLQLQVQ